jgi:hypothetical protein
MDETGLGGSRSFHSLNEKGRLFVYLVLQIEHIDSEFNFRVFPRFCYLPLLAGLEKKKEKEGLDGGIGLRQTKKRAMISIVEIIAPELEGG